REAEEVMRPARLGAGAGEALAPEGLHADRRPDHVAVHVEVSRARAAAHALDRLLDAAVDAHREPVALRVDPVDHVLQRAALEADDMEDRPEDLAVDRIETRDLVGAR